MATDTATRFLGNCQFCEGDFKVIGRKIERVDVDGETVEQPMDGAMVHHGYKRPGYGYIVGDCPGVGEQPYEVSCNALKSALDPLRKTIAGLKDYLHRLESGAVTELHGVDYVTAKSVTFRKSEMSSYDWERKLKDASFKQKTEIAMAERTLARFQERIAAWKPEFIRTIEEERIKREVQKKKREADLAARRQVQREKRAAIDAKHAAHDAKKQAIIDEGVAKLKALAAASDPKTNRWKALDLLSKLSKKLGWSYYHPNKWGIDDELIALGVAKHNDGGYLNVDHY